MLEYATKLAVRHYDLDVPDRPKPFLNKVFPFKEDKKVEALLKAAKTLD